MIKFAACIFQRSLNILFFEIGQFLKNLVMAEASCQQIKDISYPYTQSSNAWSSATFFGVKGDPFLPIVNDDVLCSVSNVIKSESVWIKNGFDVKNISQGNAC